MPNHESEPLSDKNIDEVLHQAVDSVNKKEWLKDDSILKKEWGDKISAEALDKDKQVNQFVQKESEGLNPYAQEIIDIYVPLAQTFEEQMNREKPYDRQTMFIAIRNLEDITSQIGEQLAEIFRYEKFAGDKAQFEALKKEIAETLVKDAEALKKTEQITQEQINDLTDPIATKYQLLRNLIGDLFSHSLLEKDTQRYQKLPDRIVEKIRTVEVNYNQTNK